MHVPHDEEAQLQFKGLDPYQQKQWHDHLARLLAEAIKNGQEIFSWIPLQKFFASKKNSNFPD